MARKHPWGGYDHDPGILRRTRRLQTAVLPIVDGFTIRCHHAHPRGHGSYPSTHQARMARFLSFFSYHVESVKISNDAKNCPKARDEEGGNGRVVQASKRPCQASRGVHYHHGPWTILAGGFCLVPMFQRLPSFATDWLDFLVRQIEVRGRQEPNRQATSRHEINNTMFIQKDQIQSPGTGGHGAFCMHIRVHTYVACTMDGAYCVPRMRCIFSTERDPPTYEYTHLPVLNLAASYCGKGRKKKSRGP